MQRLGDHLADPPAVVGGTAAELGDLVVPPVGADGADLAVGGVRGTGEDDLGLVAGGVHGGPAVEQVLEALHRRVGSEDDRADRLGEVPDEAQVHPSAGQAAVAGQRGAKA